jgi:hypothetical protein
VFRYADDQRDLPFDPGGVHPRRAAVRVRAPDGLRPPVLLVRHAVRVHEGRKMSVDDVMAQVRAFGARSSRSPAGSRCSSQDVYPLMDRLLAAGLSVMLETGGHLSIERVPAGVVRVVDVKCPGSGESERNDWPNLERLRRDRRGEVRHQGPRRLRVRARRHRAVRADRARARGAVLARARRAGPEAAGGVDPRGPAARAAPAPGPQVHLGRQARGV